jgi:hypothetical protein
MYRLALLLAPALAFAQIPEQAARGEVLFHNAEKGCATCHALGGKGTAVGPDLKNLARLSPRAIAIAIRATRTQYVQEVETETEKFPGMESAKDGTSISYYDLSKTPPELKKFEKAQIKSTKDNTTWKHPPESLGLENAQLADIIAYIRWIALKDKKTIDPTEVQ